MIKEIFELVDVSSDEQYLSLGLFRSIDAAINIVNARGVALLDGFEEWGKLEIRHRYLGSIADPTVVWEKVFALDEGAES